MENESKLLEYKNVYIILLPRGNHIICMGSDGKWDDYYYNYDYYYYDYAADISNFEDGA